MEVEARFVFKGNSATQFVGRLRIKDGDPSVVESFELQTVPPGMNPDQMAISPYAATTAPR